VLYQQGGEIVDIEVADQISLIFDVDPDKVMLRAAFGPGDKGAGIVAATAAPAGTQAGDNPGRRRAVRGCCW